MNVTFGTVLVCCAKVDAVYMCINLSVSNVFHCHRTAATSDEFTSKDHLIALTMDKILSAEVRSFGSITEIILHDKEKNINSEIMGTPVSWTVETASDKGTKHFNC